MNTWGIDVATHDAKKLMKIYKKKDFGF